MWPQTLDLEFLEFYSLHSKLESLLCGLGL
jgi:hypothetical protein